jgi:protein tyrosine phosphatase (PTP) superfamily phosphohydrolase (DUF442 family)
VRNPRWAVPITLEGVANLYRISPNLYRSEQPTALGMKNLEQLGIRTVVNLRFFNNDRKEVAGTLLRTERVKILTWDIDDEQVIEVMRILRNPHNGPYLIHCQHGADRTGLMSAMYRILEAGLDRGRRAGGAHRGWLRLPLDVVEHPALRAQRRRSKSASEIERSVRGSTRTVTAN